MKVLLLEDEFVLRESITEFLEDVGYDVDGYGNGDAAFEGVFDHAYDVLLLDVNVPGINGIELLKNLRAEGRKIPAIFLTSMTQIGDLERGYEAGCCDYIRKPFDLTELKLRIDQAYRSFYYRNAERLDLGDGLTYDTVHGELHHHDEPVMLSKTESEMLALLLRHRNQAVAITTFQDEIWGEYVDPANIRVQINNLRKKLPKDLIRNRRGVGYILER